MAKRLEWEKVAKSQQVIKKGSQSIFDELPPVGSFADRIRFLGRKLGKVVSQPQLYIEPEVSPEQEIERLLNDLKILLCFSIPRCLRRGCTE